MPGLTVARGLSDAPPIVHNLVMFKRVQALRFRGLKFVDQPLDNFVALVGPNASGKSTFLDIIGLLCALTRSRGDVVGTIRERSSSFEDLLWLREGKSFQLALEAEVPTELLDRLPATKRDLRLVRYEIEIGLDSETNELGINVERLALVEPVTASHPAQPALFPGLREAPDSLFQGKTKSTRGRTGLVNKTPGGNDNFYPEGKQGKNTFQPSFKLGRTRSALAHVPPDENTFPISTWFREALETGVQSIVLHSQQIRQPSPPGLGLAFQPSGANLPWVIRELKRDKERFESWLRHVRTALEDIVDIDSIERPEDKHRYIVVRYASGAEVPSWLVSDGTLRLLALTLPAYLPDTKGTFLIEEPENGIHPRAIETVLQSLRSVYRGQVILATHSPVALNLLELSEVLCFAKNSEGATDIVSGDSHPALRSWKEERPDLGVLFASGILS